MTTESLKPHPDQRERRTSLLIKLEDRPGALESVLRAFSNNNVNLTQIESRPAQGNNFDFFVDCAVSPDDPRMAAILAELELAAVNLLLLDDRLVAWFPRHISELDLIANNTLDYTPEADTNLEADHPGFADEAYRNRRTHIDGLARAYRHGATFPVVDYTAVETATWADVYQRVRALHTQYACAEYQRALRQLELHCGYAQDNIPQGRDISRFLESRTGFRLRPVAGLLSPRDFLNGLAFRVFFSTQYIRHQSKPLYTPEPDICHELIGHAPMFADPAFADLSQEIGLASLGASDAEIERLARCYWHSVEFGLLEEDGIRTAYGAGLLSSSGELSYACSTQVSDAKAPGFRPWEPAKAAEQDFPITQYQPLYFVATSLQDAKTRMRSFCRGLPRPFYARYNPATERIWVDRAVRREPESD